MRCRFGDGLKYSQSRVSLVARLRLLTLNIPPEIAAQYAIVGIGRDGSVGLFENQHIAQVFGQALLPGFIADIRTRLSQERAVLVAELAGSIHHKT